MTSLLLSWQTHDTRPLGLRKAVPVLCGVQDKKTFLLSALLAGIGCWGMDLTRTSCTGTTSAMYMLYSSCSCLVCKEQAWSKQCTCCIHHASACSQGTSVVKTMYMYGIHHAAASFTRNKCGQNNVPVVFIMQLPRSQGTSVVKAKTTYQISQWRFLKIRWLLALTVSLLFWARMYLQKNCAHWISNLISSNGVRWVSGWTRTCTHHLVTWYLTASHCKGNNILANRNWTNCKYNLGLYTHNNSNSKNFNHLTRGNL